jgi:hypothetical protein
MQLQVSLVYAVTVLLKMRGQTWPNGTALYYTGRLEEFQRFPLPFVQDSLLLINLLTYWTLATEVALAFLIWIPVLRPLVLLSGILLHAGIEYSMNVPLFGLTMVATYLLFIDVEPLIQAIRQLGQRSSLRQVMNHGLRKLAKSGSDELTVPAASDVVPSESESSVAITTRAEITTVVAPEHSAP